MKVGIYLIVLVLQMVTICHAQTITLNEFLNLIHKNHPLFAKEELSSKIEEKGRDSYLGSQDWRITSTPYYARQNPLPPVVFAPERVDQTSIGAVAERAFWKTGGRLSLSWSSVFTDQIGLEDIVIPNVITIPTGPPEFYQNNLYLTYSQPLLQNYKGELDRLGYETSQYSVDVAGVQALENKEEFLLTMGLQFLNWVLLSEQKTIATERLHLAERQLEQTQKKRAANLVDEVDVLRSEDAVRIAEQGVVLIDGLWKGNQAELAVLSRSEELYTLGPEFNLYDRRDRPTLDEATSRLRSQSRLLELLAIQQAQLERQQRGFEEMTKPQLYLNTQIALKSGDDKFGDAMGFDKRDMGVSLQFSYPLGNRSAITKVEQTAIQVRQIKLAEEEVALGLEGGLRNLLIQIEEIERVLSLNERQMETARLKTQEELKRYNRGRGDLTFVIQSQDNEERAKLTYAQNAATYHGLNLRLSALLDELLPSNAE
ncbi:TolC family protein [candidate division KSB1 bacterium]|nr:TolC family protein [candidate division KSB1 bacterium]